MNQNGKFDWATRWWFKLGRATRWGIVVGLLGAACITGGVYAYIQYTEEKEVEDLAQDLKEGFQKGMDPNLSPEEKREHFEQLRERMENLNDEQKQQLRQTMMNGMKDQMMKPIREYFHLKSEEEKNAHLDKQIDQMEEMRKRFSQFRPPRPQNGNPGENQANRPSGPPPRTSNAQGNGSGNRPGPGSGPRTPPTQEQRDQWRRGFLDNTTPKERAMWAEYREAMKKRREERGLPPMRGPWGG